MADSEQITTEEPKNDSVKNETDIESGDAPAPKNNIAGDLAGQLMQNPSVLAAIQGRLQGLVGLPGGYIQSLPKPVKRRIKALKKMQFDTTKLESKFYEEVHQLECKYATLYEPFYIKRRDVLTGAIEPTDDDCDWPSDEEDDQGAELANGAGVLQDDLKCKATLQEEGAEKEKEKESEEKKEEENPTGIPYFWWTVFKNVEMLSEMIQDHDEPIFKTLQDVTVKHHDKDPYGFTLEFHFDTNDYFTNKLLTKEYTLRMDPDEEDPFSYEGPEIIKCKGCDIDWKKGKNVTKKTIKKTQRNKHKGTTRQITKQVQNDSFFNFFSPPQASEGVEEIDEETEALLAADFEIGHFIRERIVPRSVLYFTGEALEDEDDYEDEGEEEDDEDEDGDDDEDNDADFVPGPKIGGPRRKAKDKSASNNN